MKNIFFPIFVIVLFLGCQNSQDLEFNTFVKSIEEKEKVHFLYEVLKAEPFHKFTVIDLLEKEENNFPINHYRKLVDDLSKFQLNRLDEKNQVAIKIADSFLQNKIAILENGKEGDAKFYSVISILKKDAQNESQTNEEQFEKIIQGLEKIPKYFSEAKTIIKNPDEEQLKLAVAAYSKDYFFIKNDLPTLIRKPDILKETQIDFANKNQKALIAIKDFLAFLNSHLFELNDSI